MGATRDIRSRVVDGGGDPLQGRLRWDAPKSLWFSLHSAVALVFALSTVSVSALCVFLGLSALTLCGGHSLGMHRRWIHESYQCPKWLERVGVGLGTLVGLGGPLRMMRAHDVRDWAQRQTACHPFYSQHNPFWRDMVWQLHFTFEPHTPPEFVPPAKYLRDPWMRLLQHGSMLPNAALSLVLWASGGWAWVVWGVSVRVVVSMFGHAAVGWFAHNRGHQSFTRPEASVQGFDVPLMALVSFGEAYHNNHHAFPECANLGLQPGQWDPGFWVLRQLERLGLIWDIQAEPVTSHGDIAPLRVPRTFRGSVPTKP